MRHPIIQFFLLFFLIFAGRAMSIENINSPKEKEIILVGASIGEAWRIDQLTKRVDFPGYSFDYVGVGNFDKSKLINDIASRNKKPDFVMIKECSTYFPGDSSSYQRSIETWVAQLKRSGIKPILVTTAPVGEPKGLISKAKIAIKHLFGLRSWLDEITEYNNWLRQYVARENIPIFDLEAVLRISESNKYLNPDYDSGDMVHLTPAAYRAMDHEFFLFLKKMESTPVTNH